MRARFSASPAYLHAKALRTHQTAIGDCVMEPAYLSALAALAGSTIGGLTSLTASWLTQHVQFRTQLRASNLNRCEQLYE